MLVPTHCDWLFLPLLLADSDLLVFTEVQYPRSERANPLTGLIVLRFYGPVYFWIHFKTIFPEKLDPLFLLFHECIPEV